MIGDLLGIAPLLILVVAGLVIMLVDAFTKARWALAPLTALSLGGAAWVALRVATGVDVPAPDFVTRYLAVDDLGFFFDVVICVGTGLCALLAGGYLKEHGLERGEFPLSRFPNDYFPALLNCHRQ